jgi:hypothetical protein
VIVFYLRTPEVLIVGAALGTPKLFPKALPTAGALGRGAAGPVFRHVGTTFVEPTVAGYEPTEGATTDPYPAVPSVCASANVLVRVKAVASAIVVTFMSCPSCRWMGDNRIVCSTVPLKSSLSAMQAAKPFTSRRAESSSNRLPSRVIRLRCCDLDVARVRWVTGAVRNSPDEWVKRFLQLLPFRGFCQPVFHQRVFHFLSGTRRLPTAHGLQCGELGF